MMTRLLSAICISLLATPIKAQDVGGEVSLMHQWHGTLSEDEFGSNIAAAGDINADGIPDVLVYSLNNAVAKWSGRVSAYSGLDGTLLYEWSSVDQYDKFGTVLEGIGDVDQDGYDDVLIFGRNNRRISVYSGATGNLVYEISHPRYPSKVSKLGDFNNDGIADIGITVTNLHTNIYSGKNGMRIHHWKDQYWPKMISDYDMDGVDDVLLGNPNFKTSQKENIGQILIRSGADGTILNSWTGVEVSTGFGSNFGAAGDFNQDGAPDYFASGMFRDHIGIFSGLNGDLLFEWTKHRTNCLSAGDFDGDGTDDIMAFPTTQDSSRPVHIYSGRNGELIKAAPEDPGHYLYRRCGDLDLDGRDEILRGNPSGDTNGLWNNGTVSAFSFQTFLQADSNTISSTQGGEINLSLSFPADTIPRKYRVLASASGVGPTLFGTLVPLSYDPLFIRCYSGIYYSGANSDLFGALPATGHIQASINISSGALTGIVGTTIHVAAVASFPNKLPHLSSISVPVEILP